nr:hypothetical protein [Oscillatoria salina]
MTTAQLKQYLSENRNNNSRFSEALSELMSRNSNPTVYPPDLPLEEIERVMQDKIKEVRQANQSE